MHAADRATRHCEGAGFKSFLQHLHSWGPHFPVYKMPMREWNVPRPGVFLFVFANILFVLRAKEKKTKASPVPRQRLFRKASFMPSWDCRPSMSFGPRPGHQQTRLLNSSLAYSDHKGQSKMLSSECPHEAGRRLWLPRSLSLGVIPRPWGAINCAAQLFLDIPERVTLAWEA